MVTSTESIVYEFDNFRIDVGKRLLWNGGDAPIPLRPKVFDTLLYLIVHRGRLIDKNELMSAIWQDTIVEENNLNKNISTLRQVLGENPQQHRFIVTVPGKGYKFVAPVIERVQPSEPPRPIVKDLERTDPEISNDREKPSRFWLVTLAVAVVAGLFLVGSYTFPDMEPPPISSVA